MGVFKIGDIVRIVNKERFIGYADLSDDRLFKVTDVTRRIIYNSAGRKANPTDKMSVESLDGALEFFSLSPAELIFISRPSPCIPPQNKEEQPKISQHDAVNHPSHYCKGGMECIDVIRAAVSDLDGFEAFCTGCAIKYLWRFKGKNGVEDLKKAQTYIAMMIKELEKDG